MSTFFVVRYDFRAPGATPAERQELFARSVEQVAHADRCGFGSAMVSEHHSSDDGYLPSPIPVASAWAAVTSRMPISVSALLVNLYDPIRLAEDVAVLDHLSGGRVSYTLGLGYREVEYDLFGRSWRTRGADIEDRIGVLLRALTGEPFEHDGRTVQVTPAPYSRPHPFMFYGGGSPAAARRAGRLGLGFAPQHPDRTLKALYAETCRELGRDPGLVILPPPAPAVVFCSEDPDAFWAAFGHHLLADARAYEDWHGNNESWVRDAATTVEELRAGDTYVVATPEELVARCRAGLRLVSAHPGCGGMPADPSWESQRLIGEKVIPAVSG